jgi:hypothetical protein
VIERLTRALDWLAGSSAAELHDARALANCADAVRLALDCMQQELSGDQREVLSALSDQLEESDVAPAVLIRAAQRARTLLGR